MPRTIDLPPAPVARAAGRGTAPARPTPLCAAGRSTSTASRPFAPAPPTTTPRVGSPPIAKRASTSCVSLSSPLGIEELPPKEAQPLLDAWHYGAAALPDGLRAWASVSSTAPDVEGLRTRLTAGFVGVQLPATLPTTPEGWLAAGPVLAAVEAADRPVLVHPGPVPADASAAGRPAWWAAVVDYTAQLQAAWWAARSRRACPLPTSAGGLLCRGRTRSPPSGALHRSGWRRQRRRRPWAVRRHLVVRAEGDRRPGAGARDRRRRAGQRPSVRDLARPPARRGGGERPVPEPARLLGLAHPAPVAGGAA